MRYHLVRLLSYRNLSNEILFSRRGGKEQIMRCYLVNPSTRKYVFDDISIEDCNILESFIYIRKNEKFMELINLCKTMRGVRNNGQMSVAHLTGVFQSNGEARREFYKLIELQR